MKHLTYLFLLTLLSAAPASAGELGVWHEAFPDSNSDRATRQMTVLGGGMEATMAAGVGAVALAGSQVAEEELASRLKGVNARIAADKGNGNLFDLSLEKRDILRQTRENQLRSGKIAPVGQAEHALAANNKIFKKFALAGVAYVMVDGTLRVVNAINHRDSGLFPAAVLASTFVKKSITGTPQEIPVLPAESDEKSKSAN